MIRKHSLALTLMALSACAWTSTSMAHEPAAEKPVTPTASLPPALVLPPIDGPSPWSKAPILDSPDRFQIAIMTDRTGGHRPGIWMKAVDRLNLLRPTFVMSVGDLIEGYTLDPNQVEKEWAEFLGFIDKLQMKFFFVAGNHDVTNPLMQEIWRKKFGPTWYSFDYKNVHFVALCSEDPVDRLGPQQLQWLQEDLQKSRDARWTFLFFHKPLWVYSERAQAAGNPDTTGWPKVVELLDGRPHTVFAGHVHHYVQYQRKGYDYYHLATTGGGSNLRGVPYGEFDHVTWLTMEHDGPRVIHLTLDGMLPPDAVTEEKIARFRRFLAGATVDVAPILLDQGDGLTEASIELRLTNRFEEPIAVEGSISGLPIRGLTVDPEQLALTAEAGKQAADSVRIGFAQPMSFDHLSRTVYQAKVRTTGPGEPLTAELSVPVILDRAYRAMPLAEAAIDGKLPSAAPLPLATPEKPVLLGTAENWKGPGDASARFGFGLHNGSLVLLADVTDDQVAKGDAVTLYLDARPLEERKKTSALRKGFFEITVPAIATPGQAPLQVRGVDAPRLLHDSTAASKPSAAGYTIELALPLAVIHELQGTDWHSVQVAVGIRDTDSEADGPCTVLWRGSKQVDRFNTNYAFLRPAE